MKIDVEKATLSYLGLNASLFAAQIVLSRQCLGCNHDHDHCAFLDLGNMADAIPHISQTLALNMASLVPLPDDG